jgi:hypothetical protein
MHFMRILCAALVLTGCLDGGGGSRLLVTGETAAAPTTTTKQCTALPMDGYQLGEAMSIEAGILQVSVSYGGGCEDHTFVACWNGAVTTTSDPESLLLTLAHDAHDDLCDAFVTRDLFIDISDLPTGFGAPVRASDTEIRLVQGL